MSKLPKEVHAQRTITYKIDDELLESLAENNDINVAEVTLEHIMEYIKDLAYEDINSAWADVVFLNENGKEINNA
jgi:hypothetical protein